MKLRRFLGVTFIVAWLGFWFWAFSFAYSDAYFRYNLPTRIPLLLGGLAVTVTSPVSFIVLLGRVRDRYIGKLKAFMLHAAHCAIAWIFFWIVVIVPSRLPGKFHMSADDGMGAGIDLAICLGVIVASVGVFAATLLFYHPAGELSDRQRSSSA